MILRSLSARMALRNICVLLRVDWNMSIKQTSSEDWLKIRQSFDTIDALAARGAIVCVLTHFGRPKKVEAAFSTQQLVRAIRRETGRVFTFHSELIKDVATAKRLAKRLRESAPGSVHVLENVRFLPGEERNDARLAKRYALLGDIFINDAFAASHRAHVSVCGIAAHLPAYAGPQLIREVEMSERWLQASVSPSLAIIGGFKLTTKMPVLHALLARCDALYLGGAMATACFAAQGYEIGKSVIEKEGVALAKKLLKQKKIVLPQDVMVTRSLKGSITLRCVTPDRVSKQDMIVDAGFATLKAWGADIRRAKTILWNGPLGISEVAACGAGSRFIARAMARRTKAGGAFTMIGGGDTVPIAASTRTVQELTHVSMGGGALLEFLAHDGVLPGLECLKQ